MKYKFAIMCPFAFEEQSYQSKVFIKHFLRAIAVTFFFYFTLYLSTLCTLSHNVYLYKITKKESVFMFVLSSVRTVQKEEQ